MYGIVGLLIVAVVTGVADPGGTPDVSKADSLHREAIALFAEQDQWTRAAELLEEAASLRAEADPKRAEELRLAGQVHWQAGNTDKAERLLLASAEAWSARGAVLDAAHAYLSAAEMASKNGRVRRAWSLVDVASMLAESPHLSAGERASIVGRLPQPARS